jgi:2-polyprenyl-3-methyl-5-hydroxy-6-metoxy-1,4-benzoquinol methylase
LGGKEGATAGYRIGNRGIFECRENDGWRVMGIEPSEVAREAAKQNYGLDVREEKELGELIDGDYQAITMWHVLEHVPDLSSRMQTLKRLLHAEGFLIIAVPNRQAHDAEYYNQFWAAYDVPRHLWHFRPKDIRALAEQNGFRVAEIKPMVFDAYYVSLLSEKYKSGSTSYLAAIWRGWLSNRKAGTEKWSSQIYILQHK